MPSSSNDPLAHLDFDHDLDADAGPEQTFPNITDLPMKCLACGEPWAAEFLEQVASLQILPKDVFCVSCQKCHLLTGRADRRWPMPDHRRWIVLKTRTAATRMYGPRREKSRRRGVHFS